jgi:hypothetical protein
VFNDIRKALMAAVKAKETEEGGGGMPIASEPNEEESEVK